MLAALINETNLSTILTSVSGAAIGAVIALTGVLLTNRSNTARLKMQLDHDAGQRKAQVLRDRGEELYVLVENWLNSFSGHYLNISFVMQGKLTYDQALDLDKEALGRSGLQFSRIALLIDIYFPGSRSGYDQMINARTKVNKVECAFKHAYDRGDFDGEKFLRPYVEAQKEIEAAGEVLKDKLIEAIRAI